MLSTNNNLQNVYNINVYLQYQDEKLILNNFNFSTKHIISYGVLKDSVNYNYNLHLLKLTLVDLFVMSLLKNTDNVFHIQLVENSKIISDKNFRIVLVNTLDDVDQLYTVQVLLISELSHKFINTHNYSKISTMGTTDADVSITPFQTFSKILQAINLEEKDINVYFNDSGSIKQIFQSIRIPETYNNLTLFDYLIDKFPPYILDPYIILDDLYIDPILGTNDGKSYSLIVNNLCNLSNYNLQNVQKIVRYIGKNLNFIKKEPLLDTNEMNLVLGSTLIIKNLIENKIFKLEPAIQSLKNGKTKVINSSLDIEMYKRLLQVRKQLTEYPASINTWQYDRINITDISFLKTYNIDDLTVYDNLPLSIDYQFTRNQYNTYSMVTTVQFAKVPSNIIAIK